VLGRSFQSVQVAGKPWQAVQGLQPSLDLGTGPWRSGAGDT
jgi:hypothetical protein